jgi:hypothetical protein
MKGRKQIENILGITKFDLSANIIPQLSAGGVTFKNLLTDFEYF